MDRVRRRPVNLATMYSNRGRFVMGTRLGKVTTCPRDRDEDTGRG
jgi:hypothetical protein